MAFTCKPCHERPMSAYCATMFEIGRADSFGPCENCRVPSPCMDCSCRVKREDMPDPMTRDESAPSHTVYVSETEESDEPGCNDCDGFVYEGEVCASCGLKGSQKRPDPCPECGGEHDRIDRRDGSCPALDENGNRRDERTRIVRQPDWKSCSACGKTGNHEHYSRPTRVPTDFMSPTGRLNDPSGHRFADAGYLGAVIHDITRRRRKMLLEDYNFGTTEMRILAKLLGLTDEQLDILGMKVLEECPGLKRFAAAYAVHGDIVFDVETEDGE